jgi:hypothetical protein
VLAPAPLLPSLPLPPPLGALEASERTMVAGTGADRWASEAESPATASIAGADTIAVVDAMSGFAFHTAPAPSLPPLLPPSPPAMIASSAFESMLACSALAALGDALAAAAAVEAAAAPAPAGAEMDALGGRARGADAATVLARRECMLARRETVAAAPPAAPAPDNIAALALFFSATCTACCSSATRSSISVTFSVRF